MNAADAQSATPPDGTGDNAVAEAAARLSTAATTRTPCPPVRDLIGRDDIAAAYAVQEQGTQARLAAGARLVGRKIGLTSPAVQQQLGVDQPDFGVLFEDMAYADGDVIEAGVILQPRAEAEIAFVLKDDLAEGPLDLAQVRAAIDYAVAALEICGSRIQDWDISFGDTVADNASAGAYVLGANQVSPADFEPSETVMSVDINGEQVSTGTGAACLGDPLAAVAWLAQTARDLGEPLRAGQVILSGALGPMRPIAPGDTVRAVVEPLGTVEFSLSKEQS